MRVAIVDDNAGIRRLLGELLVDRAGVDLVGEAADGDEVLELVAATAPDLVIMDYAMPRVDGVSATRTLHAAHPEVRIVAFTSISEPAIVDGFLTGGASRQFDKSEVDALVAYVSSQAAAVG
jgi:DNA-binding NarL/FixJ family response regulator